MATQTPVELPTRADGRHSRWPIWLAIFLVFIGAGLLQSLSVDWSRPLTEYDEVPHIDYAVRLADGQMTTWDDTYTQRTLGIAQCLEEGSPDPNCMARENWIAQDRWPNGHSYQAQQAPTGYLPYAFALRFLISDADNHFAQIRELRLVNGVLWLLFGLAWTFLVLRVTRRLIASLAATVVVATNPLVFDSFTYVTNDAAALVVGTGVCAWLFGLLRRKQLPSPLVWITIAGVSGVFVGLTKATALIVLIPLGLAAWASHRFGGLPAVPRQWWWALLLTAFTGAASGVGYQRFVQSQSRLTFDEVFSVILPRGPLDLPDSAFVRVQDITEMMVGSGARTEQVLLESGMRTVSSVVLTFAIVSALAFIVSLSLRHERFETLASIDHAALGIAILAGALTLLIALPALWEIQGDFLTYVNIGRYLATLIPLAGLVVLITYQRFRMWAFLTIVIGLLVAFFSGPWSHVESNLSFVADSLGF